ncbi:MAG: helix-turn-helix domain-containing protein [Micromonosporaceae bacterium]|nr:helix-turn-helix domain-containing protein [Micromonosporaceae bacterium]
MTGGIVESDLLTTGKVAELLGVSRQHVVDLCERGLLPYVKVGSHRRVRREDLDQMLAGRLTRDQERAVWLHRVVAAKLVLDPDGVMDKAQSNLEHLQQVHPRGMAAHWLLRWRRTFDRGLDAVLETLTSSAPHAVELRQNSPFAGVLTDEERLRALENFRRHWRRAHAA